MKSKFSILDFNSAVLEELKQISSPHEWSDTFNPESNLIAGSLHHQINTELALRFDSQMSSNQTGFHFLNKSEDQNLKMSFGFFEWLMSGKTVCEFVMSHLADTLVKKKSAAIYLNLNIFEPIGIDPLEILRLFEVLYRRIETKALFIYKSTSLTKKDHSVIAQLILQRVNKN